MSNNIADMLRSIAAGNPVPNGLLHSIRLEAFGVEFYGEEAVTDCFRRAPIIFGDATVIVESVGHIGIFDGETALIADVQDGNVTRIWRLCTGEGRVGEPAVSVASDPDLAQARGEIFFCASDHPALATDAADALLSAAREAVRGGNRLDAQPYRARVFTIRAFGSAAEGAALFAVYRLVGDPFRHSGFATVVAHWKSGTHRLVRDRAGEASVALRPWTPRI